VGPRIRGRLAASLATGVLEKNQEAGMPDKRIVEKARQDAREGKSPSTQAGEFVREEMHHIREGKHGARNTKQAIAIGLSEARRAGVKLPPRGQKRTTESPSTAPRSSKRSRARSNALKREGRRAASPAALSRQAKESAKRRGSANRQAAARKAAQTRAR
jgi:hypothetical protein